MVRLASAVADEMGIDAEIIDLRSLDRAGLDWETIGTSIRKTNNVVVLEQGPLVASYWPQRRPTRSRIASSTSSISRSNAFTGDILPPASPRRSNGPHSSAPQKSARASFRSWLILGPADACGGDAVAAVAGTGRPEICRQKLKARLAWREPSQGNRPPEEAGHEWRPPVRGCRGHRRASGIGEAVCRELDAPGIERRSCRSGRTSQRCRAGNRRAFFADVADQPELERCAELIEAELGAATILVNSAGIIQQPLPPEELNLAVWDEIIRVDQRGTYISCLTFGRRMAMRGCGSIVNIASIAGMRSVPLHAYAPAKAAHGPDVRVRGTVSYMNELRAWALLAVLASRAN